MPRGVRVPQPKVLATSTRGAASTKRVLRRTDKGDSSGDRRLAIIRPRNRDIKPEPDFEGGGETHL